MPGPDSTGQPSDDDTSSTETDITVDSVTESERPASQEPDSAADVDLLLDPVEIADTEGQRQVWAEPGAADAPHAAPAVVIPASAYVPGPYEPAAGAPPATAKKRKRVLWTVAAVVAAA